MKLYSRIIHKENTNKGRVEVFAECGCQTVGNNFQPCHIHATAQDELAQAFLQRLLEDQERYDTGILCVSRDMVSETDPVFDGK